MNIFRPEYYDRFRCIAGECPDSCCREWDVAVDEASAGRYRSLPGELGDRLRQVLREEDGETVMTIENGRCPMWRADGLCRIQAELGEAALCHVCREYPRLKHDYGGFVEQGLALSCPEAARLILNAPPSALKESVEESADAAPGEYDPEDMKLLLETRETMLRLLSDETRPIAETLTAALFYGYQVQGELDGGERQPFDREAALQEAKQLAKPGAVREFLDFYRSLELLTPEWEQMLDDPGFGQWEKRHLALARYLTERYWLQAVSDFDLYSRVKFIVSSCLLVKLLGGDILRTAQLFSKEIENASENVEAILDGAYGAQALRDDKLLGLLGKV